jgi:hypothetical protein
MDAVSLIARPPRATFLSGVANLASSLAEVASLAVFIAMIWVWAALASAPGV